MKKTEELLSKPFPKSDWDEESATQLFDIFMSSFSKGGIIDCLQLDLECKIKNKVFIDFKVICEGMVKGYREHNFKIMRNSIKKLITLYRFINNNKGK